MIIKAKLVVPDSRTVIKNGAVFFSQSEVKQVDTWEKISANGPTNNILDFGNAVVLPGWVNAHTHLELTNLRNIVQRKKKFVDWIWQIAASKKQESSSWILKSIQDGLKMSWKSGTTTIGNIHQSLDGLQAFKSTPLRTTVFYETLGFNTKLETTYIDRLENLITQSLPATKLYQPAISPHAPYSTSPYRYKHSLDVAQKYGFHLSTHISETQAEIEFLKTGRGDFSHLLEKLGIPYHAWQPPKVTPITYLDQLGVLKMGPQLVHCNYLSDEDISCIAQTGSSVVFCPGSHQYFFHTNYPLEQLIRAGISIAIGTDSLASNWSLDMRDELRRLLGFGANYLSGESILDMLTINGAKSLGWSKVGRLKKGWQADLVAISLPSTTIETIDDILRQIAKPNAQNLLTVVAGEIVYQHNHN